jgi:hypothetical protein
MLKKARAAHQPDVGGSPLAHCCSLPLEFEAARLALKHLLQSSTSAGETWNRPAIAKSDGVCHHAVDRQQPTPSDREADGTDRKPQSHDPDTRHHDVASDAGGQRAACMYTILESAKMNGINPQAYLTDIIGRIADYPIHKIDDLLPWQWKS